MKSKSKKIAEHGYKGKISRKYFLVCFLSVFVSLFIISVVVLVIASQFFEQDKYDTMQRNTVVAAEVTAGKYPLFALDNDQHPIVAVYTMLSETIGADFLLVNLQGEVVFFTKENTEHLYGTMVIPEAVQEKALQGDYKGTGEFANVSDGPVYVVGVPVIQNGEAVGTIFSISSAQDLVDFLRSMLKMLLIVSAVVLAVAFLLISYVTRRLLKPVNQMVEATYSFSKGDFSSRIPVSTHDEIGQLSMAFNDMASALATMESSNRFFIANVSHELKTPMTTIGGFVDGILDGTVPDERKDQYLQIVSLEVKRLSRLIHAMLDTARIEAGEMKIELSVFDISELVRQTIFSFEQKIEEKELEIRGLEEDRIMVSADKDLMHQVVYNIIENAVKFVDFRGYISFAYEIEENMTYISITNSGDGLSKDDVKRIFDRFYKSDRSRTDSSSTGVGLGLHIVRSVLAFHHGEIEVISEEGEFTCFRFGIPSAQTE